MVATSEHGEFMRTYKVGLRLPESLLREQEELVMALEILNHLHREMKHPGASKLFTHKLANCSKDVMLRHVALIKKYSTLNSLQQLDMEIFKVRKGLKQLHWKNPKLHAGNFSRKDIPSFSNPAAPQPSEMSLTDYQYLARTGLKLVSKHLNDRILREITRVPHQKGKFLELAFEISQREGRNYSMNQLQQRFEIALSNITGIHSNVGRTAFYQLGMALKGYFDLRVKVQHLKGILTPEEPARANFSDVIPVLLFFYSPPNHLRNYLGSAWGVERNWVRNTLVGWRRRIDKHLSAEYQVEPLTEIFMEMANGMKAHARGEGEVRVISMLQKRHVLHLLLSREIDLRPLLSKSLHESHANLQERIAETSLAKGLRPHLHALTIQELLEGLEALTTQVSDVQSSFPPGSKPHVNSQGFLNKLEFLREKLSTPSPELQEIFSSFIIGNRFTSSIARLLSHGSRYRKLFTALRGILALTLARKYPMAIGQFLSAFNPDSCLTFPFCSNTRKKTNLPVNLLFNKYIVERKAHPSADEYLVNESHLTKSNVSDLFKQGKPIWLGLPVFSHSQEREFQEILEGARKYTSRKGMLWFQVLPSKKIVSCLKRGAQVRDIRLNVPSGPTKKIIVDVVLSAPERGVFQHEGKFLTAWDEKFTALNVPGHEFIGVDLNRIGSYMVSTASPDEEHDLSEMMGFYQAIHEKLEKIRKREIPHVQARLGNGLTKKGKLLTPELRGRLEGQLGLLHRRSQRIMVEMKRQALMVYLYVGWKSRASYFGWDAISGIATRNMNGALAQAITYLPKRKGLLVEFMEWAFDLNRQGQLPAYIGMVPVSPYTSTTCAACFQNTGIHSHSCKKSIPYDEFTCETCGRSTQTSLVVNRHSNAARMNALLVQQQVYSQGSTTS